MALIICPDCNKELAAKQCMNCKHYKPQYIEQQGSYVRTSFGICTYPQAKPKKDSDRCVNWDGQQGCPEFGNHERRQRWKK